MEVQDDGCTSNQNTSQSSYIRVPVEGVTSTILIDTGASHSFISKYLFENKFQHLSNYFVTEKKSIVVANNASMESTGFIQMKILIGSITTTAKLWVLENLCTGIILGIDWLTSNTHKANINFETNSLSINKNGTISSVNLLKFNTNQNHNVRICNDCPLNPMEEKLVEIKIVDLPNCDTAQFNPTPRLIYQDAILIPHALIQVENYRSLMTIRNISNQSRIIKKNTPIGTVEVESPNSNCYMISGIETSSTTQPAQEINKVISNEIEETLKQMTLHLKENQKQLLLPILYKHHSLFDLSKPKIARTNIEHNIETGDHLPVNSRPYRINQEKQKILDEEINSLHKADLIRPSQSAWSSPVVLVKKKDGKYRFCVDYRRVNQITIKDSYPLPHIEETIGQLSGSSYFSKMDMKSGYFQLPINEKDKAKTAFITSRGLWEFNVLPQGLKNSPPSFQRVLNNLLANGRWDFCLIYLDDIIIYSKSFNEHCQHLNDVLTVLNQANFQLNPPKCSFARPEIDYLGHTINEKGFKPLGTNIDAIIKTPNPRTAKQVHSFLQMANFYRKFIHDFTELTRILRPFQQKYMKFYWGKDEQIAWDMLKKALTTPPVFLNFPLYNHETNKRYPFILSTDASQYGIAGALKQQTPDGLKPIVYVSRTLSPTERNYSTFERECLGIVWSVTKLRDYLADESFIIETDQQPARNIHLNRSSTNRRVNNWKLQLQDYDIIEIKHKPGKSNCDADYMSHHPLIIKEEINNDLDGICMVMTRSKTKQLNNNMTNSPVSTATTSITNSPSYYTPKSSPLDPIRLKLEQDQDLDIQQLITSIDIKEKDHYKMIDGILNVKLPNDKCVPFIPKTLRYEILHAFYDHPTAGHFGRDKTWYRLKDRCFWPNMYRDVVQYIHSCTSCMRYNIRRHKPPGQMQLIEPPGGVFDLVQMDFTGPLRTSASGNRFVICLTDYLSKYVICKAVPNETATTAAEFISEISLQFGPPHRIQTDRGTHFTAALFEQITRKIGCSHTVATPYHPQSQGVVERFNATFKQQLAKYTNEHGDDWDDYLQTVVSSYNSAVHQVTQFPPFEIFYTRKPVSLFDPARKSVTLPKISDYWNYILQCEKIYIKQVRRNIEQQQRKNKLRYDRNRPQVQFMLGQQVFVIIPGCRPTFGELYEGPYTIIKQIGPLTFDVMNVDGEEKRVHSSQMKPIFERE